MTKFELFENIKLERLEKLYKIINLNTTNISNIKIIYSRDNIFLQEHLNFLIDINLVNTFKNNVFIKEKNIENFKEVLLKKLSQKEAYASIIKEYLENFKKNTNNVYTFKPKSIYNLNSSNLRNFLITLKIVKYTKDDYIILNNEILKKFLNTNYSPKQLKIDLEKKALLGLMAEKMILKKEKEKLSKIDKKLLPDHVAMRDVAAGYDILSFEKKNNKINKIYIEVKAVSSSNHRFFLSNNELLTANKYKEFYYIYLLPVDPTNDLKFDYNKLLKINNINDNIINDKENWLVKDNGSEITKKLNN